MSSFDKLIEELARLAPETPDEVAVIGLDQRPDQIDRGTAVARRITGALGVDIGTGGVERRSATTVFRQESGARATVFNASGAMSYCAGIKPFAELFSADPGDQKLTEAVASWTEKLQLRDIMFPADRLDLERLWRIKAAGSDPNGSLSDPVLCRAVGALRHRVRDLPVLGRASAHLEITGGGNLSGMSLSLRRWADSDDQVITTVRPREAVDAASEVAARVARMLGGSQDGDLVAESFRFGYVSLGRRRPQGLLAPMYVAALSIVGTREQTRSAHMIVVDGSDERFMKMPSGSGPTTRPRAA